MQVSLSFSYYQDQYLEHVASIFHYYNGRLCLCQEYFCQCLITERNTILSLSYFQYIKGKSKAQLHPEHTHLLHRILSLQASRTSHNLSIYLWATIGYLSIALRNLLLLLVGLVIIHLRVPANHVAQSLLHSIILFVSFFFIISLISQLSIVGYVPLAVHILVIHI